MPYAAGYSISRDSQRAVEEICAQVTPRLSQAAPDISFLFVQHEHAPAFEQIVTEVQAATRSRHLVAVTVETAIAGHLELEQAPAISLWSAILPGATVDSFHVEFESTPDGPICSGLPDSPADPKETRAVLLVADPFTCAIETLMARLDDDLPGVALLGGMASGGMAPGENLLAWNGRVVVRGGVGAIIRGGPRIESVVSQGCRPIGAPMVITKADRNIVLELGGKTALSRLEETYSALSARDRELIRQGLHLGLAMDEHKAAFSRGDFLIANVLGADRELGAIAVGKLVRPGQTVQFHIRDAETADEDLRQLLSTRLQAASAAPGPPFAPAGALLFSCNGRGTRLFAEPNHDAGVLSELCGPIPLAGFFAQGELGPVGGRNYIHGFTASVALFAGG